MNMSKLKALFLIILLSAGISGNASAATFTVNSVTDAVDANPGDGTCATAEAVCTLRAAIQEANAFAGQDTIILPEGIYVLTIEGQGEDASATGDLDITDTAGVIIQGDGSALTIVDGKGIDRVFHIQPGSAADISGIMIQGGIGPLTYGDNFGGGILNVGGTLTITGCTVYNNTASYGGGILNLGGTLTITGSTISGNIMIVDGGGIYNYAGDVTITNCTVTGNISSDGFGNYGGILNGNNMIIQNSTIKDNSAYLYAGIENYGDMTITNCTISNNISTGNYFGNECGGAGLHNETTITIQNSTIVDNTPVNISNGDDCVGFGGPFIINNSIVASNDTANVNCVFAPPPFLIPFDDSSRNNLSTDATCGEYFTQNTAAEINLGALTNNGGPTDTMGLLTGSVAIEAGDDSSCPATDQRGVLRPSGSHCDIGAFEFVSGLTQTITVTTHAPANAVYNTSFIVTANASSLLGVAITTSGECSGSGTGSALITMTSGTGSCTVKYDQTGDGTYSPAPQVTETTTAQKAGQTITVTNHAPGSSAYDASFPVSATASSGLAVAIIASGACSGGGIGSETITMTCANVPCIVHYNQAGDSNYDAASEITETAGVRSILTIALSGTGIGTVSGNGTDCSWNGNASSGTCWGCYNNNGFNLYEIPGACSFFDGWETAYAEDGNSCGVTVRFARYPLTRLSPPANGYDIIATAYTAYNNTIGEVIQIQEHTFSEDLVFDRPVDVAIEAGWNCDYTQLNGVAGIKSLTVQSGSMMIQKGGFVIAP